MAIDLPSLGSTTFHKLKQMKEDLPLKIVKKPSFEDELFIHFLNTEIVFGTVLLPLERVIGEVSSLRRHTFFFHPAHGLWIVNYNESRSRYPACSMEDFSSFMTFLETVEEEWLYEEIPIQSMIVFKNLTDFQCDIDFSAAPFSVAFRDTLHLIPEDICGKLSQSTTNDDSVDLHAMCALGALQVFGEIRFDGMKAIGCCENQVESLISDRLSA